MKVDIEVVAKKAGLSRSTVSRVIRNYPGVKESTRQKVEKAIKELNYEVNSIARNLRQKKSNTIGIIFGKVFDLFFSAIAKTIENIANKAGYNVILCYSDDDAEKELASLRILNSSRVEGIILVASGKNSEYIKTLISSGTKVVLLDRLIEGVNCDAVLIDNFKGGYLATKHLLEQGYKRVAIINGSMDFMTGKERLNGYLKALDEFGIESDKNLIKNGCFTKKFGAEATIEILKYSDKRPDAIFTTNLDLTLGALDILYEQKIQIPEQIGIVGFDDSDWSHLLKPKLTVIDYPLYQFGATAAELLIRKIQNKNNDFSDKPVIVKLDTYLIVKESSIKK